MNIPHLLKLLGWNQRPLTFTDFEAACEQQQIIVQYAPIKTPGMYFHCEDRPVITLSNQLVGTMLWLVAWHELAHHLLHHPRIRCFTRGTLNKAEEEAHLIATCAVLDEQTLYRILVHGELHDFPRKVIDRRILFAERHHI